MRKLWIQCMRKVLLIIPYIIFLSFSDILLAVPQDRALTESLWYSIFGRVSSEDMQTLILTTESLGVFFLYALLFGNYISDYFASVSTIVFTRIHNRKCWGIQKIAVLSGLGFLYTALFLILKFIIEIRQVIDWNFDVPTLVSLLILFGVIFPVLLLVCLLVNGISIRHSTAIAILLVFVIVVLLQVIAIANFDNVVNQLLNPLCFHIDVLYYPKLALIKILIDFLYLAISIIGIIIYIEHIEIF